MLTLESAAIAADGVATVTFTIADAEGAPLDLEGRFTEGAVNVRFVLAALGDHTISHSQRYTAYTTRTQTSTITGVTATQAAADMGGTFAEVGVDEGRYTYTFAAPATDADRAAVHTVGAWAERDVDGESFDASATLDFVPDGGTPDSREVITDASCSSCHGEVRAHGARRGVRLCVTCHSPQTSDPDTGEELDFSIMVHRIHRGAGLPSVVAGDPFVIIGNRGSVHDFSHVQFPQPIQRCQSCHQGSDAELAFERPSAPSCTSCHDDISFVEPVPEGMRLHSGGTQPIDAPCAVCHPSTGSIAGLRENHLLPLFDPASPELDLEILGVDPTPPGTPPVVRFRVTYDGVPRDILTMPLSLLRATVSGPNEPDFTAFLQTTAQGSGARGTLTALDAAAGEFQFALPATSALALDASGSHTLGFEGYVTVGTARVTAEGPLAPFAVTDPEPVPRRTVVETERCNQCHYDLMGHGGSRRGVDSCTQCHIPGNVNDERISRFEGRTQLVEPVALAHMIHRIHGGEIRTQPYILGTFPPPSATNPAGAPHDFGEVQYPRDPAECTACHLTDTWRIAPPVGRASSYREIRNCTEPVDDDADAFCNDPYWVVAERITLPATAAACTGCHDDAATLAHTQVNTTAAGVESCAVCHGTGAVNDIGPAHGMP